MFTRETQVPTTPAHQQATDETVTCLSMDCAESVTIAAAAERSVLPARR